jgi:hypothetical protein
MPCRQIEMVVGSGIWVSNLDTLDVINAAHFVRVQVLKQRASRRAGFVNWIGCRKRADDQTMHSIGA